MKDRSLFTCFEDINLSIVASTVRTVRTKCSTMARVFRTGMLIQMAARASLHFVRGKDSACWLHARTVSETVPWSRSATDSVAVATNQCPEMDRDLTLVTAFTQSGQLTHSLPPYEYSVNITKYDRFSNCYVMRDRVPASGSFLSFSRKSNNVRNNAIFSDLSRPPHRNRFLWSESTSPSTENVLLPPPWRLKPESLKNFQNTSVRYPPGKRDSSGVTFCVSRLLRHRTAVGSESTSA